MTVVGFLVLLVIAALAGLLGQILAGNEIGGCLVSAAVGFVGAIIGLWLARALGLPLFLDIRVGGQNFPVVWAVIGSTLFAAVLGLFTRRRRAA